MKDIKLSPRQRQLVAKILVGIPLKRAAGELGISHSTARCHMRIVYARFGVVSMQTFMALFIEKPEEAA